MASIFKQSRSPFWYLRIKGADGRWLKRSTKYRVDDPLETKRARAEAYAESSRELDNVALPSDDRWAAWVPQFLATHASGGTLKGYMQSWDWLASYLAEKRIDAPAHLNYATAFAFIDWRHATRAKKPIARSTALRDLKVLRLVMRHAVRTGRAKGNPCDRMGLERPAPKQKRELTDEDITKIYSALLTQKPWMQAVFQIALETGCRISEADIRAITINEKQRTLTFEAPKGGTKKAFTTILPAGLGEKLAELRKKFGIAALYPEVAASQKFRKFFRKIGLKDVSMHCTRVTYITRLGRSSIHRVFGEIGTMKFNRLGIEPAHFVPVTLCPVQNASLSARSDRGWMVVNFRLRCSQSFKGGYGKFVSLFGSSSVPVQRFRYIGGRPPPKFIETSDVVK